MRNRHPLPRRWLMTDPRLGNLEAVVQCLPRGTGIIFRHYDLALRERRALFDRVRAIARKRRLMLVLAASPATAAGWNADGAHDRSPRPSRGIRTAAVHNNRDRMTAYRAGADLIFVSPVFATRSHPGSRPLGLARAGLVAGPMRHRTVALGGIDERRARALRVLGFYGWAGIDAFRT